jgi:hypothetical protein
MSVLSTPTRTPAAPKRGPSVLSNDSYTENERSVRFRYDQAHAHDPHLPPSPVTPGSHLPPAVGVGVLFADDEEKITPCGATVSQLGGGINPSS